MSEPWFNEVWFGALYGAVVGGGGGTIIGLWGALVGSLAPQGKGRTPILAAAALFIVLGLASLGFGVAALVSGQPYAIVYPPLLCGLVITGVVGSLIPVVRKRYAEAEARRLEAEGFRHS
jgi:hypothetical protein